MEVKIRKGGSVYVYAVVAAPYRDLLGSKKCIKQQINEKPDN